MVPAALARVQQVLAAREREALARGAARGAAELAEAELAAVRRAVVVKPAALAVRVELVGPAVVAGAVARVAAQAVDPEGDLAASMSVSGRAQA